MVGHLPPLLPPPVPVSAHHLPPPHQSLVGYPSYNLPSPFQPPMSSSALLGQSSSPLHHLSQQQQQQHQQIQHQHQIQQQQSSGGTTRRSTCFILRRPCRLHLCSRRCCPSACPLPILGERWPCPASGTAKPISTSWPASPGTTKRSLSTSHLCGPSLMGGGRYRYSEWYLVECRPFQPINPAALDLDNLQHFITTDGPLVGRESLALSSFLAMSIGTHNLYSCILCIPTSPGRLLDDG